MGKNPWYLRLGLGIGLGGTGLWAVLGILARFDIYLWILGISTEEILWFLPYISLLLTLIFGAILLCRRITRSKTAVKVLAGLLTAGVLLLGYVSSFFWSVDGYEVYTSPDGEHTIVVKKESWLMASWGSVFEVDSPFTMRKRCDYSNGDWVNTGVDIRWYEDYFILSYEKEVGGDAEKVYYLK